MEFRYILHQYDYRVIADDLTQEGFLAKMDELGIPYMFDKDGYCHLLDNSYWYETVVVCA